MTSSIGNQIKKFRLSHSWTQSQLADKLNVSAQTVSNWEAGLKSPRMGAIQKMASLFNVNESEIVSDYSDSLIKNAKNAKTADLADEDVIFTYEGKKIPPEDLEYMKRILRGGKA